jgi:hypothetical protein
VGTAVLEVVALEEMGHMDHMRKVLAVGSLVLVEDTILAAERHTACPEILELVAEERRVPTVLVEDKIVEGTAAVVVRPAQVEPDLEDRLVVVELDVEPEPGPAEVLDEIRPKYLY